ncbi:MAG: hypothetical protein WCQ50_08110 [Spirochaetota bacterium]
MAARPQNEGCQENGTETHHDAFEELLFAALELAQETDEEPGCSQAGSNPGGKSDPDPGDEPALAALF